MKRCRFASTGRRPQPSSDRPVVICVDPAFFKGTAELALRNWAGRTGEVRRLNYGALPLPVFVRIGVGMLDKAIRKALAEGRQVYVIGWSEGAQVIYKWLRDKGPTSDIDPGSVTFISLGNPERLHGGACVVPSPPAKLFGLIQKPRASYGGCGIPADTPCRVVDLAREGDGWADVATVRNPSELALSIPDDRWHMDYFTIAIDDPAMLTHTEGNITWALLPNSAIAQCDREATTQDFERPPYVRAPIRL